MFFILSKALLFLLSPFFWLILSISVAIFFKEGRWKNYGKYASIIIFLLFTNSALFLKIVKQWEVPGIEIKSIDQQYEVGIVLTGMAEYNNELNVLSIRRGADRIWQAITLYKQGVIKKILITGKSGFISDRGLNEAQQFKDVLVQWGIPANDILVETESRNTYENAIFTKKILTISYPHIQKCLLITSGLHMKRAKACFDKAEIPCDVFSTDLYTNQQGHLYWDQWCIPSVSTLLNWQFVNKEWVGYISYKIAGYC